MFTDVCKTEGRSMKDQPNWFPKVHRMPSEWVMPDHFPDLSGYDEIAIDLETRDPGIKDTGPGYIRKNGEVVGIAVAVGLLIAGFVARQWKSSKNLDGSREEDGPSFE